MEGTTADSSQNSDLNRNHNVSPSKRPKRSTNEAKGQLIKKRENFVRACRKVSFLAYSNYCKRFLLSYTPDCLAGNCKHSKAKGAIPKYAVESFKSEIENHMWPEAVDVCYMSLTPEHYLSDRVLKGLIYSILNVHDTKEQTASFVIDKCQQIMFDNFKTHPPCIINSDRTNTLRDCYNNFLSSQMNFKIKNTNGIITKSDRGVVTSCFTRLEYELDIETPEEAILTKEDLIPKKKSDYVGCMDYEKEIEIFEALNKKERIDRLFAVLESVLELLQFDLAMWYFSSINLARGQRLKRSDKPLMRRVLWPSDNMEVNKYSLCVQIARIFVNLVELKYPEEHIKTMAIWLNTTIQTVYHCNLNINEDYPTIGKLVKAYTSEIYKIIEDLPLNNIIKVLEYLYPTFMRSELGTMYLQKILDTTEVCLLKIMKQFLEESHWKNFPISNCLFKSPHVFPSPKKISNKLKYLQKACHVRDSSKENSQESLRIESNTVYQEQVLHILYISVDAYLDAISFRDHQDTLHELNELLETDSAENPEDDFQFNVTEVFVKKYKQVYEDLKIIIMLLDKLKKSGRLPSQDFILKMQSIGLCNG